MSNPIALVAACLLRPTLVPSAGRRVLDFALPVGVGILIAARSGALDVGLRDFGAIGLLLVFVPSALALYALAERPLGFASASRRHAARRCSPWTCTA